MKFGNHPPSRQKRIARLKELLSRWEESTAGREQFDLQAETHIALLRSAIATEENK